MGANTTSFNNKGNACSKACLPRLVLGAKLAQAAVLGGVSCAGDGAESTFAPKIRLALAILVAALAWAFAPARAQGQDHHQYLPLIFRPEGPCPFDALVNGGFEQDDAGWTLFSNGTGHKAHDLIGRIHEGFSPLQGMYAARLGGFEGVVDSIQQPVLIPSQGVLSYYWKMYTNEEPTIVYDYFLANLLNPDGTRLANLATHDNRDQNNIWVQDVIDLSAYAGQLVLLQLNSANDNNFWTKFDIDEVRLCGQGD